MSSIIVYGDSIMRGTLVSDNWTYHATMSKRIREIEASYGLSIKNRARFGMTAPQGAQLMARDLEGGLQADYALIEFGGNDCNFDWPAIAAAPEGAHLPVTCLSRFEQVYRGMITALRDKAIAPILMTLPPIDAGRYLERIVSAGNDCKRVLSWLGDASMIYRFQELYSATIAKIAVETGSLLVDVRSYFLDKHNYSLLIGPDGIHLTDAGYQLMISSITDFTRKRQALAGY